MKNLPQHRKSKRQGRALLILLLLCLLIVGGAWSFLHFQRKAIEETKVAQAARVEAAELALAHDIRRHIKQAEEHIERRDIVSLKAIVRKVSILDTKGDFSDQIAQLLRQHDRLVARDREIERLKKSAKSAIEAEDIPSAEKLLSELKLLECSELNLLEAKLTKQREKIKKREELLKSFSEQLKYYQLERAEQTIQEIELVVSDLKILSSLRADFIKTQETDRLVSAVAKSVALKDSGNYSAELVEEVDRALTEYPLHPELLALSKKLNAYPQIVKVPGDVASLDEAIRLARANDVIQLGEGRHYAELEINKPVQLSGAGAMLTIVESRTVNGPALHFTHNEGQSKVSDLTLHGDRECGSQQPLVSVEGAQVVIENAELKASSGRGILVMAGKLTMRHSKVSDNAWDGISACGTTTSVELESCISSFNGGHGVDIWKGANGSVKKCELVDNGASGLVAIGKGTQLHVWDTHSHKNSEAGYYLSRLAEVRCEGAKASENLFSGFVVKAAKVRFSQCKSDRNGEYGVLYRAESVFEGVVELTGSDNKIGLWGRKK